MVEVLAPEVVVDGPGQTTAFPELGDEDEPSDHPAVARRTSNLGEEPKPTRS